MIFICVHLKRLGLNECCTRTLNPCPRTFESQQRPKTLNNTYHFTPPYTTVCYVTILGIQKIGQNTRGRSPHASLDINTTSNYCPVSLARVAQLVERRTPDSEAPGSNPKNTQLFFLFFFSSFVESMFNTTQKSHLKKKRKKKLSI